MSAGEKRASRSRRGAAWTRLDNMAKLYASASSKRDPKVFRFACELTEPVSPKLLQTALAATLEQFPLFRSVLRRGLFWYYLEPSSIEPQIREENRPPCTPLYDRVARNLLFSVSYYRRRINLEVYHVLTDGTGALQFLRTLVFQYLVNAHREAFGPTLPVLDYDASETEKRSDSFQKYAADGPLPKKEKSPAAAHLEGQRLPRYGLRVIEGELPAAEVIARVKALHSTMTPYLCAQLLCAIAAELPVRERKKPLVLAIPVNLRNYYESGTSRNFFSVFYASYRFTGEEDTPEKVAAAISEQFSKELSGPKLAERMRRMAALAHHPATRIVPLFLKDVSLAAADWVNAKSVTGGLSNLGRVDMPKECAPYLHHFDVFMSSNRMQLCACSYGGRLTLSLTSPFVATDVQRRFFRAFSHAGIPVTISANPEEEARLIRDSGVSKAPHANPPKKAEPKPNPGNKKSRGRKGHDSHGETL